MDNEQLDEKTENIGEMSDEPKTEVPSFVSLNEKKYITLDEKTENIGEMSDEPKTEVPSFVSLNEKKYITLDETITFQAIICVVISIIFIAANMFAPDIAEQLSDEFKENYYSSAEKTDNVLEAFLEFVNSKPVSYD